MTARSNMPGENVGHAPAPVRSKDGQLTSRILDADTRCSQWLADGNAAMEAGMHERANRCYDKSQFWMDRRSALQMKLDALNIRQHALARSEAHDG